MKRPSPKTKFLSDLQLVNQHLDMVSTPTFQRASEVAFLKFVGDAPLDVNTEAAAANYHRIIGAREFLRTLIEIGDQPEPLSKMEMPHLNHQR